MKYPEALFQFVMGKHKVGQPICWLKFMVHICAEGGLVDKTEYILQHGDHGYEDDLDDDYTENMKKLIDFVKK